MYSHLQKNVWFHCIPCAGVDALPGEGTRLWTQLPPNTSSCRKGVGKWKLCVHSKLGFAYLWVANGPFGTSVSCSLLNCWETHLLPTGYSKLLHTNLTKLNGYIILLLLIEIAFVSSFSCCSFSILQTQPLFIKLCVPTPRHILTEERTVTTTALKLHQLHFLSWSFPFQYLQLSQSYIEL